MYTDNYEQEINLKDLLFSVLYRWRILLFAAVAGMILIGGYKALKVTGDKIATETADSYEEEFTRFMEERAAVEKTVRNLKASIDEQNYYIANAPLMQINPYNEVISAADVVVKSKDSTESSMDSLLALYKSFLLGGDYLDKLADENGYESRHLRELLSITEESMNSDLPHVSMMVSPLYENHQEIKLLHIKVKGTDSQATEKILEEVLNELETLHALYKTKLGEHELDIQKMPVSETVDTDLLDWQQKVRSNARTLKKELEESQKSLNSLKEPVVSMSAEHSIKSSVKYAIIGFFAGGFMAVFAVSVQYILNDKVTSDKEIRNRIGLKSLGAFYQAPRKRMLGFIDSWLRRMAGDDKVWPDDAVLEMITTNIGNYASGKTRLFITVFASQDTMDKVCQQIHKDLPELCVETARDMISNASVRKAIAECEGIILVEERNTSKYSLIAQELELASNIGCEVIGVVVS